MASLNNFADWMPAAVVFDCDGLLMDTESCWGMVAETAIFARRGRGYGPEERALLIGKSVPTASILLANLFNEPGGAAAVAEELLQLVENIIAEHAKPLPGAMEIVSALNGILPLAIASNSPRRLLDLALSRGGFSDLLPFTVAADEVEAPKLAPELYLRACEMLRVKPQTAVAFEDSVTGATSARAAGLRVVGIPSLANVVLPADILLPSLLDSKLQAWVGHWRDRTLALKS